MLIDKAGKIPQVASQIPAYLAAVLDSSSTHVSIRYPAAPMVAKKVTT
jgi:hypothetical protein